MKFDKNHLLLYAVTDRSLLGETTLAHQVEAALNGGATFVQLREKELDEKSIYHQAVVLKELCKLHQVPFVINDFVELALLVGADGVHVGQEDLAAKKVRAALGSDKIMGVSVQNVDQAKEAEEAGADYLGVGAVFPTTTKTNASEVNLETLKKICEAVSIPVVAIGGITKTRVAELKNSGVAGVAVVNAIFGQADITAATQLLLNECKEVLKT